MWNDPDDDQDEVDAPTEEQVESSRKQQDEFSKKESEVEKGDQ